MLENLKLKTYLLAERIIDQRAKGIDTPWPFWAQLTRSAAITGFALGSLTLIISETTPLRESIGNIITNNTSVCLKPQLYSEPGVSSFTDKLNMSNRYGGGIDIGLYTELDMDIGVDPDNLRLALGRSLGIEKTWNAGAFQPIFLFLHATFIPEGYRESYLDNEVGKNIEEYTIMYLHQRQLIPEVGRTLKVSIPLFDVINRAIVTHAGRIETHKSLGFRSAVTQELVTEMRKGLGEELIKSGVIPAIPPLTNANLLHIQEPISVDYIPVGTIRAACYFANFSNL